MLQREQARMVFAEQIQIDLFSPGQIVSSALYTTTTACDLPLCLCTTLFLLKLSFAGIPNTLAV